MAWCLEEGGLRPRTWTPSRTRSTRRSPSPPRRWACRTRGTGCACSTPSARRSSSPPRCRACPLDGAVRAARGRARGVGRAGVAVPGRERPVARRPRGALVPPRGPLRPRPPRGPREPGAAALARAGLRVPHRAPGLPAVERRVQGHGARVVRRAALPRRPARGAPRDGRRRLRRRGARLGALGAAPHGRRHVGHRARRPGRARRPRGVGAGAARGGARRPRHVAPRADGRPRADHGGRHGAELRRELAGLARVAVRGGLGPARGGRLRHGAGRGAPARRGGGRHRRADGLGGARPRVGRRGARPVAAHGAGPFTTPDDLPAEVGRILADDGVVAWFDGRAELGRARWGTAPCSRTPDRWRTWSGSTT